MPECVAMITMMITISAMVMQTSAMPSARSSGRNHAIRSSDPLVVLDTIPDRCSLSTKYYGHMASCSFPVEGERLGSEVCVRLVRAQGVPSSFVHNCIGTGKWRVMSATATLPGAGGLPRTLNLVNSGDETGNQSGGDRVAGQTIFTFQDLIDWR